MAKEEIGFNVTVEGTEKSISSFKDLKTAIKAAKDEQVEMTEKFGSTSVEATNAAKKVSALKDKIDDLNDSSKTLKGTGFEMLKGGFAQIREGLMNLDFDKVKIGLISMAEGFKSMGKSALESLKTIKGALIATGIGVFLIALGTIYAYWDDIKGLVDGLTPELKKQNELAKENLKTQQEKYDAILLSENSLKLQGKTEREILQLKIDQTNEEIKASEIALLRSIFTTRAQIEASKRNKDILQGLIDAVVSPITILLKGIDLAGKAFGKDFGLAEGFTGGIAKMMFDPEEVTAEGNKAIKESQLVLDKLKSQRDGHKLAINAIDTKADEELRKKGIENAKAAAQKRLEDEKKLLADIEKAKEESYIKTLKSEQTQAIAKAQFQNNDLIASINSTTASQATKNKALAQAEITLQENILQIQKDYKVKQDAIEKAAKDKKDAQDKEDEVAFQTTQKAKIANYLSRLESEYQLETQRLTNEGKNLQAGSQAEEENNANKVKLQRAHLAELYNINIANAKLLGLDVTNIENKNQQDKEAAEDAARERKKAKEKKLQQDIVESVNIAAQTILSYQKTSSDIYYMKETQKINKLYRDKLKNVEKGSKEETKILEQKEKDEKNLARKQFETQKKFNRASAILNGILGLGAIFAVPDPTLGIVSAIRALALVATTASNISQIDATQFDEGGSSAGAIPKPEEVPDTKKEVPSIYGPGQGQSTTFSGNQNNSFAPVKAYVVETENRSTTNRVNKLVSESTYG